MNTPLLELKDLTFEREGKRILHIPHFIVSGGETLVLLGPNGAGKSSLLRILGLLEKPTKGSIIWKGSPCILSRDREVMRRSIAMVLQEPYLFDMTVWENIAYGLRIRKMSLPLIKEKVNSLMAQLHIGHLGRRGIRGLSGGEAHRVSLARALVLEPELLLLDEPFNSLDIPSREEQQAFLKDLLHSLTVTAVYVTHDRREASCMAHRMALLTEGAVIQTGTPRELFSHPLTRKIAAFMGYETIVEGAVELTSDNTALFTTGGRQVHCLDRNGLRGRAFMCLRAEEVVLEKSAVARNGLNMLPGRVTSVIDLGNSYRIAVDAGFSVVASITAASFEKLALAQGDEVTAMFPVHSVHLVPE